MRNIVKMAHHFGSETFFPSWKHLAQLKEEEEEEEEEEGIFYVI